MNIYNLPIVIDETMKNKTTARIYDHKIVCHPDLLEKVTEGMALLRASAAGYKNDMEKLAIAGKRSAEEGTKLKEARLKGDEK